MKSQKVEQKVAGYLKKAIIGGILMFCFNLAPLFAQWEPEQRLTFDDSISYTCLNNARCVAAMPGGVVHLVWTDRRDGNYEIYYKRSIDGGTSWSPDTRLTNNPDNASDPSVSVSGTNVHVVWFDNRDGNWEIYYKRSTDSGTNWFQDTRLTNAPNFSVHPSTFVSGTNVHVVWYDDRDGNWEIYYKRSTDSGVNWSADTRLTNDPNISYHSSVSVSDTMVHVVWEDDRDGNYEIYYKRSIDGGTSWSPDTHLTNDPNISYHPSVSVSDTMVHVVWGDRRDGNYEIYYKRSIDGGTSWSPDTRLTNAPNYSLYPSISVSDANVHVVWHELRDGNWEIYYKRSADSGVNWSADTRLTNDLNESAFPFVSVSDTMVHVVWRDDRDGNYEIYYKRNPTGNNIGVEESETSSMDFSFVLFQNQPNPMSKSTMIQLSLPTKQKVLLTIFNTLGRRIKTLVDEEVGTGIYKVIWDGCDENGDKIPDGVYFYCLETKGFSLTRKLVLLR